ncbi:hypothetical protein, partial [Pantoea agglomerans]|uniref:hypothetical protein n=1 Tax=Enterobacter agglomerans TaxID=549 RepID=UPI0035247754
LLQVRLNRRERFRLMRQHHPQGEAHDGPRLSCTTHQFRIKRLYGAFFVSAIERFPALQGKTAFSSYFRL